MTVACHYERDIMADIGPSTVHEQVVWSEYQELLT